MTEDGKGWLEAMTDRYLTFGTKYRLYSLGVLKEVRFDKNQIVVHYYKGQGTIDRVDVINLTDVTSAIVVVR